MRKITQLETLKIRWLTSDVWKLLILVLFLSVFTTQAQTYSYTGSVQTVTLAAGSYEIEMWGANGGSNQAPDTGGKGGYSKGILNVATPGTYYIYVGGRGMGQPASGVSAIGGFNGGGNSGAYSSTSNPGGSAGGGATHIATVSGLLNTLSGNQSAVVIVAGGGGGAGTNNGAATLINNGAHGGGLTGGKGFSGNYGGFGGTQTAGGSNATATLYSGTMAQDGSFGQGGSANLSNPGFSPYPGNTGGGGGGGWYGGAAALWEGAGGGSGYIGGVMNGVTIMFGQTGFVPNPDPTGNGMVVITSMAPCSGTPSAGTISSTATSTCPAAPFTLSVTGATRGGNITYQWQSSPAGANTWTNINGATGMFYTVTSILANTDYRYVVTCINSSSTQVSNLVSVTVKPIVDCYCTPVYTTGCATYNLNSFVMAGENATVISDLNTGCNSTTATGYSQRMSLFTPIDLIQEGTYPVQINSNSTSTLVRASIWIDFNGNGAFETSERILTDFQLVASPAFATTSIEIPANATPGIHRMRVRMVYNVTGIDPCTSYASGETHDYNVNVIATNCYKPLDIQESNVTKNSVTVTLTPSPNNSGTVAYEYEVRESGAPGSGATGLGVTGTATTNPFTITGLQPLTKYTIYVRTVCSPTDKSSWTWGPDISTMCNYPDLIAAPGKTVCGSQEVDLTAIYGAGTVFWYDDPNGANLVHTGATFRTPLLTGSRSYWVQAGDAPSSLPSVSGAARVAPANGASGFGNTTLAYGVQFNAASAFNIKSVDVYPSGTSAGTITLVLADKNGNILETVGPLTIPAGTGTTIPTATPVTIPLNITVPIADTGYRLYVTNLTVPLIRESSGLTFPYPIGTLGNVTAGWAAGSASASTYYYFYNWEIGDNVCNTPLLEVPVVITPKPAFELSSSMATSCEGGVTTTPVTITTNLGGYDTFVWTPSTGVSGDAVNGWTFSTSVEQDYVLSASQSGGICEHLKTVRVFAGKKPEALSTLAATYDLCKNEVKELKALEALPAMVTIGTGVSTTLPTSATSAFVQSGVYSKQQYIYSAAELLAQGFNTAGYITNLSFETINSGASLSNASYTIKMKLTANTTFGTTNFETGNLSTVYSKENHTHTFQGVQTFNFDSPFYWDGQSNVLVEITQEGAGSGNNAETYYTPVTGSNVGIFATSATDPNPATGTRTVNRLNTKFGLEQSTVTWSPTSNLYLDAATTIPYTPSTNALKVYVISSLGGSYVYNASLKAPSGCVLDKAITINVTDVVTPIVQNQTFCSATPVSNVVVSGGTGASYTFYSSATATTPITTISQTGTYYVESTQGLCKSVRVPFTATVTPLGLPTAQFTQVVCGGGTVSALMASGVAGSQIRWYDSLTSTVPLAGTQPLVDNTTYYASQVLGNCESGRIAILVDINTAPPALTPQTISICGSLNYGNVNLNQISGSELVWYPSATSQTPIPNTTAIVNGTYYVSQRINGCESLRVQITATAQGSVPAPTAGIQNICGNGTVAQLVAQILPNGTAEWYNSSTSTTPLNASTVLVSGTYYLTQRVGNCVSVKVPVSVRVINTSAPAVSPMSMCAGSTVGNLTLPSPTGVSYNWYLNNTSTTPLPLTDVLQSGYYFVTRIENGCESVRTQVQITVNSRPNSPVGTTPQQFSDYAEISSLVMNQPNVVWYATYDDAMKGNNPLSQNMPLVNGTTYYAVIIGANGCPSLPTPIEAIIVLGVNDFDLSKLKYYPNPVSDQLTITYTEAITNVEVFDLNGRMVMKRNFDNETVQLDFSTLSSGTYMLNIKTKENSQFIKIVRK
ncbi:Por secretion system C-terminal sorting domain-containing protein [Paenimyroides ummariense]|uniref:receptor protein-tyrosine kinase n=1 Tax=Paenimyroides ummariense TaxID=913024 RepID=A0A1I5BQX8_9FLAO|nr:glycine-rich protein [Paenimyroides ummariense]SFN77059.1 Por secretion system C-terminal sorting domain-containing protein [Paenimyroides ummariense]